MSLFSTTLIGKGPSHTALRRNRLGVALVTVLCAVVLVTVITLAFIAAVVIERQAAASYASGAEVRMLAESAVNLVMGQIRQASEQPNVVWTSQPGLLRTFNQNGDALRAYKLYSSLDFSPLASSFNPTNDVPLDWAQRPAEFIDINRLAVTRVAGVAHTNYPILDPGGVEPKIKGFSLDPTQGVAMPVAWLYLLEDGTITNSTGMTKANPPVARIAFWTDDETSKLNINTASEGSYWDVPRTATVDDYRMAFNQPAQREYQAYPGHPATTSLSPVLYEYFREKNPGLSLTNRADTTNTFPEVLYPMLPRTQGGGSRGGTVRLDYTNSSLAFKAGARFFASVDELAFLYPDSISTNRVTNSYITREVIEQARFFLTAHSRAPELNLFSLPRVTIWPIHAQTGSLYRTPYDNLIAFASTINSNAYYFTRADEKSPTADFSGRNVDIYKYLQQLTEQEIPGFGGGTFLDKYGDDRDQILTEVFDYVRCINLIDTSSGNPLFKTFTTNTYTTNAGWGGFWQNSEALGLGQVIPIAPPGPVGAGTRGFGRFHTINRAIFAISPISNSVNTNVNPAETNGTYVRAALFFEAFCPAQGHSPISPNYDVVIPSSQSGDFIISSGGATNTFRFAGTNRVGKFASSTGSKSIIGGYDGFAPPTLQANANPWFKMPSTNASGGFSHAIYPFVTDEIYCPWDNSTNPVIQLFGGTFQVELRTTNGIALQKIEFAFPNNALELPMPAVGTNTNAFAPNGFAARFSKNRTNDLTVDPAINPGGKATHNWITDGDIARSLEATGVQGDIRLLAVKGAGTADTAAFEPIDGYGNNVRGRFSAMATASEAVNYGGPNLPNTNNNNLPYGLLVENGALEPLGQARSPLPPNINGVRNFRNSPGDWDTGIGTHANGPMINKPDDGRAPTSGNVGSAPYITSEQISMPPGATFSSPSRQIPSAVMFGSLPTGAKANHPWQTLLFSPNPASRYGNGAAPHPGEASPRDHLLLDLFHIPVVEPYAISEPFATAGKVNMNYQIIPFTGIERKTALYGVLNPVKITAIHDSGTHYKKFGVTTGNYRFPIKIDETLKYFDQRFSTNGVFISASEICNIPLIPDPSQPVSPPYLWTSPVTTGNIDAFWESHKYTGDNLRENPYARLYPRLTTRSNTYTVHVWVETLKKLPSTPSEAWVEGKDKVTGEFRGSFLIERYMNPADSEIPDVATAASALENLNRFYRHRVISVSQFNP